MKRSLDNVDNSSKTLCSANSSDVKITVPDHFFHLGGENYVVISDFCDVIRVHVRKFWINQYGRLMPTKTGITLSAVLWQSFANKMDYLWMSSIPSKNEIVEEELIFSTM